MTSLLSSKRIAVAGTLSLLLLQPAFAAFSFTVERTDVGTRDALSIRAINDGVGGSGTDLHSFELFFDVVSAPGQPASRAYFAVNDMNGNTVPDTVDLTNAANRADVGFLRIGTAANTNLIDPGGFWLGFREPNPWAAGVSNVHILATINSQTAPATGSGALFARLLVDDGAGLNARISLGGEIGPAFRDIPIVVAPLPEPASLVTVLAASLPLARRRRG